MNKKYVIKSGEYIRPDDYCEFNAYLSGEPNIEFDVHCSTSDNISSIYDDFEREYIRYKQTKTLKAYLDWI